jgi:hypothetical protein
MSSIEGIGPPSPAVRPARAASPVRGGFAMPGGPGPEAAPAGAPGGPAAVTLETMLALQAAEDATEHDRSARRHGQAMLQALNALQRALLRDGGGVAAGAASAGGGGSGEVAAALRTLGGLAEGAPLATDPALAATLAAIVLRARVELARRGG